MQTQQQLAYTSYQSLTLSIQSMQRKPNNCKPLIYDPIYPSSSLSCPLPSLLLYNTMPVCLSVNTAAEHMDQYTHRHTHKKKRYYSLAHCNPDQSGIMINLVAIRLSGCRTLKCLFYARVVRASSCKRSHVIWAFKLFAFFFLLKYDLKPFFITLIFRLYLLFECLK